MEFIHTIHALSLCVQTRTPALLVGPVGDGKTSIIEGMAKSLDNEFCDASHTSIVALHEPPAYGGYVWPRDDVRDGSGRITEPARARQLPVDWMLRLANAKRPLLFLDEFSNGAPAVRSATMRGVLDGMWGDTHIKNLATVVAMNPPEISESGYELSAPLSNRFCQLDWDMPVEYWNRQHMAGFPLPDFGPQLSPEWELQLPWARSLVSAFAAVKPGSIKAMPASAAARAKPFPSLRSWTRAERLLAACRSVGYGIGDAKNAAVKPHDTLVALLGGCVGPGAALEFIQYAVALDLPDPETVLANPETLQLPIESDKAYAILTGVMSAVLGKPTEQRWLAGFAVLVRAAEKFNRKDIAATCARSLCAARETDPLLKNVRIPPGINVFREMLEAAGFIGKRAVR